MKILLVVNKYDLSGQMPYLTNELAEEFSRRGYSVTVALLDWDGSVVDNIDRSKDNIRVFSKNALKFHHKNKVSQAIKWLLSPFRYLSNMSVLNEPYDLAIYFSPLFVSHPAIILTRLKNYKKICIYWDFFPYHQIQIGLLPGGLIGKILQGIEEVLLKNMSHVGLMSAGNIRAFKEIYPGIRESRIFHMPIWGNLRTAEPSLTGKDADSKVCIFGGQLAPGRNLESLVEAAQYLPNNVIIKIIGDGPLRSRLQDIIDKHRINNVELHPKIPRQEYLNQLMLADIGLIITEPGLKTHSFPSKIIDYFNASKPVLAIVEPEGDFGNFIENEARCGIACYSNQARDIAKSISALLNEPNLNLLGLNGKFFFRENMTTTRIADIIIDVQKRI